MEVQVLSSALMVESVVSHFQLFVALSNIQATLAHPNITKEIESRYQDQLLDIELKILTIIEAHGSIAKLDAAIQSLEPGHPLVGDLTLDFNWMRKYQK